jgi:hypothetical protein
MIKIKIKKKDKNNKIKMIKMIKIYSTASFGEEVKPSAPCRKIIRHVKEPFEVGKGYFVR